MSESHELFDGPAPTILIVDDDEVVRTIMRAELENDGFDVSEAADGVEGLQACRMLLPDLLVVDVVMPRMDGFELCEALRADPVTAFAPILMATGLDDEASIARAYVAGATDFISKPLKWTILRQRLRYMLRSARAFQELRDTQAYLLAAKEAAEAGNRAKSEFLATMSHELRTPLNAVMGLASVMQAQPFGPLAPKYLEYIGVMLESGDHLLGMIRDVLDLAKAEANDLNLTTQPVDVVDLVGEVETVGRSFAEKGSVAFTSTIESRLPVMLADRERLRRILISLVGNAVKFTPKGGWATLEVYREPDGDLSFKVADSGIGMSPAAVEQALSPFGQVDSGSTRQYGGAGVGLPLANRFVELHGASLKIDSEEGKGTSVVVRFPKRLLVDESVLDRQSA